MPSPSLQPQDITTRVVIKLTLYLRGLIQLGVQVIRVRAHGRRARLRQRGARRRLAHRAQVPMQLAHGLHSKTEP